MIGKVGYIQCCGTESGRAMTALNMMHSSGMFAGVAHPDLQRFVLRRGIPAITTLVLCTCTTHTVSPVRG